MRKEIKRILRNIIRIKRKTKYSKASQELCRNIMKGGNFVSLTKSERRLLKGKNKYPYIAYKNMYGAREAELLRFVTNEDYVFEILPRINSINHDLIGLGKTTLLSDKNYFEMLFPELTFPATIIHKIDGIYFDTSYNRISEDEALNILLGFEHAVFKKSRGSKHGEGVVLAEQEQYGTLLNDFSQNYIVQELLRQHDTLSYFNNTSVNIIRIITVCLDGEVYVLSSKLRVGAPGSFCDHCGFGELNALDIPINDSGMFGEKAFDSDAGVFMDSVFGQKIPESLPYYMDMVAMIKKSHVKYPDYGILGWDMTVDCNGNIVCMEVNSVAPTISASQYEQGSIFYKKCKNGETIIDNIMKRQIDYTHMSII